MPFSRSMQPILLVTYCSFLFFSFLFFLFSFRINTGSLGGKGRKAKDPRPRFIQSSFSAPACACAGFISWK